MMNVNELRSKLTNLQMAFKEVKDQISFSNAEVIFAPEGLCPEWSTEETIKDITYEKRSDMD